VMLPLKAVITRVQLSIGRPLASFRHAVPFHDQSIFTICDYADSIGDDPWDAFDIKTGRAYRSISYEAGVFAHCDKILYLFDEPAGLMILLWPETEGGIQFADCRTKLIKSRWSEEESLVGFIGNAQFAKVGAATDREFTRFCGEWESLPNTFR
jgi:hypothetical protein